MKITKSQLRQIIKEEIHNVKKSMMLTEAFKSDVLRNLASGYGGLNRDFFSQTAKRYGVEWDKIEDYHIEKLRTVEFIPVDCRMFALLYASINNDGCSIILHKNCNELKKY